ncbi:preprotein translocase subunit SecG [uncultured Selenomonas sp.]|uniref:preprotein translocase subunit SecG n=1 Tax=uncultured Selenomonas sp. TaxID=159275 RepID=UPI0025E05767|nr:preprotein translocase subunit SecG [uncultured Selenomonas sp.]
MESEREERKRSIRAARDWLAGAEDALAGADDVSGDLKLMLARAELACTTSTRRARLRRRARILLPALALVALALWGLWYAQVQESAAVPAAAVEERAEVPAAQVPVEDVPVPAPQTTVAAASLPPHVTEGAEAPAAVAYETPATAPAVHESAAPPAAHPPASHLPSADMQHLMQVGGKILRE